MALPKILLSVGMALCCSMTGCRDKPQQGDGGAKKYGSLDPKDYVHPVFRRRSDLTIPGCCSLNTGPANLEILQGDDFLARIVGRSFEAEISFGFHSRLGTETADSEGSRIVDGVALKNLKAVQNNDSWQITWSAKVPVAEAARSRELVEPVLLINASCSSEDACRDLTNIISDIRF